MKILVVVDEIRVFDGESQKADTVELAIDGVKIRITKPRPKPKKKKVAERKPLSVTSTDQHKGD